MKKFNKNTIKTVVITLLVVAICASFMVLPACEQKEEKKGIVICTALLSGSLMYADSGKPLWDPLTEQVLPLNAIVDEEGHFDIKFDMLGDAIANLINNKEFFASIFAEEDGVIDHLTLDADGNSNPNVIPCTMDSEYCQKYGIFACYEELYNELNTKYGEEYEVSVFNYDWRLDIRKNGELLEKYIEEKGYDKVVLTAHSMGGNVVSNYLARSEKNRNKVEAFISCGTPYYGSMMALDLFENIDGFVDLAEDVENSPAGAFLKGVDLKSLIQDKIIPMAYSWTSLYQLMPSAELLTDSGKEGYCSIQVDGKYITTADELYSFYASRPWAKDENGSVRKAVLELRAAHESCYVEVNGEKVHSTKLVNSYYIAGTNCRTMKDLIYITEEGQLVEDDWEYADEGDGTVLSASAAYINGGNITTRENIQHIPLGVYPKNNIEVIYNAIDTAKSAQSDKGSGFTGLLNK